MEEEKKLFNDIEQDALNIDIHLEGRRNWEEFATNITKRRAVERELEIIGEATNNLLKSNPGISLSHGRKIVNLRNRVIHAYDAVDDTIIWKAVVKDIPLLIEEVRQLMSSGSE